MPIEELRREVLIARRRRRRVLAAIAVGIALPAQLGWMMWAIRPRERIRVVQRTDIVAMPTPIPVEHVVNIPAGVAACPLPRRDAPFVEPARLPEAITQVRPSVTNAGWIAAWNDDHVFISMDAGASWEPHLDGDGRVHDVTFDCFGRALVVRGQMLGILDEGDERWVGLPHLHLAEEQDWPPAANLLGGGPDIVIVGHPPRDEAWSALLAVSHDLGATWRTDPLADYWEGARVRGRQHEDGTVLAMLPLTDCMGDTPWAFRWKDGALTEIEALIGADLAFFGDRMIASNAWQRIGSEETHPLPSLDGAYPSVLEGPYPIVVAGDAAYRLADNKLRRLPWKLDGEERGLVADPAGRIWSERCGQPHVATRVMPAPCPDEPEPQ